MPRRNEHQEMWFPTSIVQLFSDWRNLFSQKTCRFLYLLARTPYRQGETFYVYFYGSDLGFSCQKSGVLGFCLLLNWTVRTDRIMLLFTVFISQTKRQCFVLFFKSKERNTGNHGLIVWDSLGFQTNVHGKVHVFYLLLVRKKNSYSILKRFCCHLREWIAWRHAPSWLWPTFNEKNSLSQLQQHLRAYNPKIRVQWSECMPFPASWDPSRSIFGAMLNLHLRRW